MPLIGHFYLVTSLFFDIGVYLVVIGLVLDILRSLGAEVDRHIEAPASRAGGGSDPRGDGLVVPAGAEAGAPSSRSACSSAAG